MTLLISGIYLTLIMAMTAMSILICVIVLNLHHRDPSAPVPVWLTKLTHGIMAPLVCMQVHMRSHRKSLNDHKAALYKTVSNCSNASDVKLPGNYVNMAGNCSGATTFTNRYQNVQRSEDGHPFDSCGSANNNNSTTTTFQRNNTVNINYLARYYKLQNKREILEEILVHVQQITSKLKEDEEEAILRTDWKVVAKILDRFFLLMFILLVVVSSLSLLVIHPALKIL